MAVVTVAQLAFLSEIVDRVFLRAGGRERAGELTTTLTEGVERLDPYFARYLPQVLLTT